MAAFARNNHLSVMMTGSANQVVSWPPARHMNLLLVRRHMALHPQLDELIDGMLPIVQDFHREGDFAPNAASIDLKGKLLGHAIVMDDTDESTPAEAIEYFESKFALQAQSGKIQAAGIFYHSPGMDASSGEVLLPPANTTDECRAIVAMLEHSCGDSVYLLIPYSGQPPQVEYGIGELIEKPAKVFLSKPTSRDSMWRYNVIALVKYLASFFKREWTIDDYPVRIWQYDANTPSFGPIKPGAWQAQIHHWWLMNGIGSTRDEAIAALNEAFNEYKRKYGTVPRPGTRAGGLASTAEIDQYSIIAYDFFQKILEMDYDNCFVSDESSLWEFPNTSDKVRVFELIEQTYHVDVSDIQTGNLVQIFKRLHKS